MTKQQIRKAIEKNGWDIRTSNTGKYYAYKGRRVLVADTLTELYKKVF